MPKSHLLHLQRLTRLRCVLAWTGTFALAFAFSLALGVSGRVVSAEPAVTFAAADIDFFENEIRPLLADHCLQCHGRDPKKVRGGLRLTSRSAMLTGGDSGPAVVPGQPEDSLLVSAVHYDDFEMPPSGQLPAELIAKLIRWIELGAPDPRKDDGSSATREIDIDAGRSFWAFQQPDRGKQARILTDSEWPESHFDALVLSKLESAGLTPNPIADRTTLIRRAYFALIGLAPSPAQIDAFLEDPNPLPTAYARVVDSLLASPHFGERWGRHWLDVARFAESSGGGRSLMFPHAWRYRDYVIAAYNKDKPFDQFVREQISGDLLPFESREQRSEQLTATGFLALGPTNYEQQNKSLLRMEVVDEQVDTVGRAFLAMTLGCARCHDHKFDPIPTSDYYAIAGIFGSTQSLVDGNVSSYVTQSLPLSEEEQQVHADYQSQVAEMTAKLNVAQAEVEKLGGHVGKKKPGKPEIRSVQSSRLAGIVMDNRAAEVIGKWMDSTFHPKYVDDGYIHNEKRYVGERRVVFAPKFEHGGRYEIRLSYSAGGNRASNVPVTIVHQDGQNAVTVNQSQSPPIDGLFVSLGTFRFEADNVASVTVGTENTDGVVIVDAVQFLAVDTETTKSATLVKPTDGQNVEDAFESENTSTDADGVVAKRLAEAQSKYARINKRLSNLKKRSPQAAPVVMSVKDVDQPTDGHIHIRGSFDNLGPVVPRGYLSVACAPRESVTIAEDASGRREFAEWIASRDNPLTARVYANRVWRHLFGVGLVATPDNFGAMGEKPSHPELLDALAEQLVADGWSTKKLIRQIMLSRVYWLSSQPNSKGTAIDVQNRLLWRANRRRLDAEVLRDTILQASGSLDRKAGGLTIRKISAYDLGYAFDTNRRSVYVPAFRNSMLPFFEVFDMANPNLVSGHRNTSTLATQALFLMNDKMIVAESRKLAQQLLAEDDADEDRGRTGSRIRMAYRRLLGRFPTDEESRIAEDYLGEFEADDEKLGDELEAWSSFCHSLMACVDFRYVE